MIISDERRAELTEYVKEKMSCWCGGCYDNVMELDGTIYYDELIAIVEILTKE
jgi:hypothetical protein